MAFGEVVMDEDNPAYITVTELYGQWHISKMEWDARAEGYIVAHSKAMRDKAAAEQFRDEWARAEDIEAR